MKTAAILLAAGQSVRMGRDKALLTLRGETLVERHLRQLRHIGIAGAVVVTNRQNDHEIHHRTGADTILQAGQTMSEAVLTGLNALPHADAVWAVCVNDIVSDQDYVRLSQSAAAPPSITVPTRRLERTFHGGYLYLADDERHVRAIIEKPAGGCPPGAAANIMIHRILGRLLLDRLRIALAAGVEYEAAINRLIVSGIPVTAVPLEFWIAIKTPDDFERARTLLESAVQ